MSTRILLFLMISVSISGCSCSDSTKELGSGYWLRIEGLGTNEILTHFADRDGVPPSVLRYNYDSRFIIAEQKPDEFDDIMHKTYKYKHGRDTIYYWIIIKSTEKVLGPLDKKQYESARSRFKVPPELQLESVY